MPGRLTGAVRLDRRTALFGAASLAIVWFAAGPALAQPTSTTPQATAPLPPGEAPPSAAAQNTIAPPGNASTVQEVVITGSRIARRDYVAESPIVTVPQQELRNDAPVTLDNALAKLPQFTGINGESNPDSGFGLTGAATLNLRNLGDNRNLVLLDGRRLQPSTTDFAVDVNILPSALIDDVEIITGGASAVYGSDAIAGVVNFKLKHNFEGVEVDAKGGVSDRGDYGNTDDSITAGANLDNGRGNVVFSFDYAHRDPTYQKDIPFYQKAFATGSGSFALSFLSLGYYQSELDSVPGAGIPNWPGFPAASPVDYGFNSDHTTLFNIATAAGYNSGVYPQNPLYAINQGVKFNSNYDYYATTPLDRYSAFSHFDYQVADNVSVYGQLLYTHYTVNNDYIPLPAANDWSVAIPLDANHPIPSSLATVLGERLDPAAPWHYSQSVTFLGQPTTENTNDTYQVILGVKGSLPVTDWTYDIYASHGESQIGSVGQQGFLLWDRYNTLLQAPDYGANYNDGHGNTCTSGISPFIDPSTISQDCKNYLQYHYHNELTQKQDIVESDFQGKVIDLPAGELRAAAGFDYRRNTLDNALDPAYEAYPGLNDVDSDLVGTFAANSSAGSSDVYEGYIEALVPILKNLPFVRSLDLDAAYRYSDYQTSGGVSTYKADLTWRITDDIRFRGGYQRAVRAPNVTELYSASQATIVIPAFDPCVNTGPFAPTGHYGNNPSNPDQAKVQALCTALTPDAPAGLYSNPYAGQGTPVLVGQLSGNPDLSPEKADTYTVGLVYTPHNLPWNSRLSASVDFYDISISDAVAALDANQTYELCFNFFGTNPTYSADNPYCKLLVREPVTGYSQTVNDVYANQGGIRTRGVDTQIDWSLPLGPGRLDLNGELNNLIDFQVSFAPGVPFVDYADTISSTSAYFRLRSLLTATYDFGKYDLGLRWKYLPSARDSSCVATCTAPATSSYSTVDIFGTYALTPKINMTGGIDNLFDTDPPVVGGVLGNTNPGEYDVVGRQFYIALKAKF